jgi:hypothetical protein
MKACHYLQVSSAIIGKHRHRSDVTGMTTSTHRQIDVASTSYQPNAAGYASACACPDQELGKIAEK